MADPKNPKLRGLMSSISQFHHDIDRDIDNAAKVLKQAQSKRTEVFTRFHDHVGERVTDITSVVDHLEELDGMMGGNGAPLDSDSETSSSNSEHSEEADEKITTFPKLGTG